MAVRRIIQVAPSNRLHRVQTLEELLVELKEQHVKLNEALRQLSLLADEASTSSVTVLRTEISGGGVDHGDLAGLSDDDHTQYQLRTEKAVASGYASLDANSLVAQKVKLVRSGLDAAVPALAEGELYWATDTDTLYIGT